MASHKTGFPKGEANGRNGYQIMAGSEPSLFLSSRRYSFPLLSTSSVPIHNSVTFSTIGPPAGIENALKSRCQRGKTVYFLCIRSAVRGVFKQEPHGGASNIHFHTTHCDPGWFSQLLPYLSLFQCVGTWKSRLWLYRWCPFRVACFHKCCACLNAHPPCCKYLTVMSPCLTYM